MASDKQGFPILTSEEAVESCKSMFGVAMSVDDILRPSVRQPVTLAEVRHQIVINFFIRTIFLLRNRAGCFITLRHILFRVCLLRDFHFISSKSFSDNLIRHNVYVQHTIRCVTTHWYFLCIQYQQMRRLYVAVLASFGVPTEQFSQVLYFISIMSLRHFVRCDCNI